jgi:hypothetical protein
MNDASRTQGWAITIGAGVLALLFVIGIFSGSYLALAVPVAVLTLFVLGLTAWVGFTIATIQIEAEPVPEAVSEAIKEPASEEA